VFPLDLRRNVVLERLEFNIATIYLSLAHRWIHQSLQTIISPFFNEFVVWLLNFGAPWRPMDGDGWNAVDALLITLAERNPDFRNLFRGHGDSLFIASYLPLVWSKGLMQFDVPREENRFELGIYNNLRSVRCRTDQRRIYLDCQLGHRNAGVLFCRMRS